MATGREGRAERLNDRLRGAQRVNVDNEGFNLNIEGISQPFSQPSSSSPAVPRQSSGPQQSPDIPSAAPEEPEEPSRPSFPGRTLRSSPRAPPAFEEEITESPIHAPGSGGRRRVPIQEASKSASRMNDALQPEPIRPIQLPPANQRAQSGRPSTTRQSTIPPTDSSDNDAADQSRDQSSDSEPPPARRPAQPPVRAPPPRSTESASASDDDGLAEEIDDRQAARSIGQKRPRVSLQPSPELGSEPEPEPVREAPAPKRPRPAPRKEPAVQRQPKKRHAAEGQQKKRGRPRKDAAQANAADDGNDPIVEITVQRFVNADDGGSDEEAQTDIPFANRSGETVVDVLAQVCEEVIGTTLGKYQYLLENTADDAKKKDCRIKMRAIESFREEVSAQLLQHSIYLNHWYSLRKRIRHVQKEKLELRQEILRLKAEKDQVAVRMDGVRARADRDGTDSKHRLDASALMHEIDLAVEQGRDEGELSSRARKEAELGNLELLISQVADQASSNGPTGGLLKQIQDFNALLERTTAALEAK